MSVPMGSARGFLRARLGGGGGGVSGWYREGFARAAVAWPVRLSCLVGGAGAFCVGCSAAVAGFGFVRQDDGRVQPVGPESDRIRVCVSVEDLTSDPR